MNRNGIIIRSEKASDHRIVENLVREAFWNVYCPGCYEHYLLHVMRSDKAFVDELNLVMEKDGEIIGQTVFVRSCIKADDGRTIPTLTLGPICIAPELKRRGYGKMLLDFAFERAREYGEGAVCFEGNFNFYSKCGCVHASDYKIRYHGMPEGEDASFFLVRVLKDGYLDGITGEYSVPEVYLVDKEAVEEFDKAFVPKVKLKLPGQLF